VLENRSYSVTELQDLSGFDRRTIVYYIQQGLVARPGRRGPNTRYPREALLRLQFIRGIKDLQNRGQLLNVTLMDIRRVIESVGQEKLQVLVSRAFPAEEIGPLFAEPPPPPAISIEPPAVPTEPPRPPTERRAFGLADAAVRQRFAGANQRPTATSPPATDRLPVGAPQAFAPRAPAEQATATTDTTEPVDLGMLSNLLRELEIRPTMTGRRLPPGASEQWTEIPITSRVFLSVRGLSADDAPLADAVARAMKKLLRLR
jgi:DNA-binding transcriptional MerR regulator